MISDDKRIELIANQIGTSVRAVYLLNSWETTVTLWRQHGERGRGEPDVRLSELG